MNSDTGSNISGSQVKPGRRLVPCRGAPAAGAARSSSSMWRRDASTPLLHRTQQGAVGLVRPFDLCAQLGRRIRHRELEAQLLDLLGVERQRRSSAPSGRRCG